MAENILLDKSYKFALRIVKLSEYLNGEARQSAEHTEFISKYSLANKEAFKTNFWLRLLRDSEYIGQNLAASLVADCEELQKLLIRSLKTARRKE